MPIATLKKRSEFLRLRGGARFACAAFVLETKPRADDSPIKGARFGFTITKQIGSAVVRNKVRRRLKAALADLAPRLAHERHDYVVVARQAVIDRDFAVLAKELEKALSRVHQPPRPDARGGQRAPAAKPD